MLGGGGKMIACRFLVAGWNRPYVVLNRDLTQRYLDIDYDVLGVG